MSTFTILRTITLLTILSVMITTPLSAQFNKTAVLTGTKPTAQEMLNNGSQGKEFYVALPMNDNQTQPITAREIYVTCSKNTTFIYELPSSGFKKAFQIKALQVYTLKPPEVPMPETEQSEQISDNVFRISSKEPVSVYVYNGKSVSSDGYLAIPTQSWGTKYMHLGYPDFNEVRPWKAGFMVISGDNDTRIKIRLRSSSIGENRIVGPNTRTEGGRRYGAVIDVTLQKGQGYMVQGDGTTRGQFDLSGSIVESNKPVGFLSYHQRTMVPSFNIQNGRDHMIEMLPPTAMWGKTYVTVEYDRGGKGDLFRAVALEDNTNIYWESFDFKTKKKLRTGIASNLKATEVRSFPSSPEAEYLPGNGSGIMGMSVWKSNKPFLLMHYSASALWDNDDNYDPFMIYVVPAEQYTRATIFQSPSNPTYSVHFFNLIALSDTNDRSQNGLKSIMLDGKYVWNISPSFLGNRIPGTPFNYARISIPNGPHVIKGDIPFGGYVYGYGSFDSYGWPAATAYRKLDQFDTLPPVLNKVENCGDFDYTATELRNFKINDTLDHVETGVNDISFLDSVVVNSYNYRIVLKKSDKKLLQDSTELPNDYANTEVEFSLRVNDKTKDAFAVIRVLDRALNFTLDTVRWIAPRFTITPNPIDFKNVRVGTPKELQVSITNPTDTSFLIKKLQLMSGGVFVIKDPIPDTGLTIRPKQTISITIVYTPTVEHLADTQFDFDSLLLEESCAKFAYYVRGRGVQPHIWVADWDAGKILVGEKRCNSRPDALEEGLLIRNTGTDTLVITSMDMTKVQTPPFTVSVPTNPNFPIKIAPKGNVLLQLICFEPKAIGKYENDIPFNHNAGNVPGNKDVSKWTGEALSPGPIITNYDFGSVRVGTRHQGTVYVGNTGSGNLTCNEVLLVQNGDSIHTLALENIRPRVNPNSTPPEKFTITAKRDSAISATVELFVKREFDLSGTVEARFDNGQTPVQGTLKGYGYLEKIAALGAEFLTPVEIRSPLTTLRSLPGQDTQFVRVWNTSTSAPLKIHSMYIDPVVDADNPHPNEFALTNTLQNVLIPIGAARNDITVTFTPTDAIPTVRRARVIIKHNASPAEENFKDTATSIVYVVGRAFQTGDPTVAGKNFGVHLTCDSSDNTITITNTILAGTPNSDISVVEAEVIGPDRNAFVVLNPPSLSNPVLVPAGQTVPISLRYFPSALRKQNASVVIRYSDTRFAPDTAVILGGGEDVNVRYTIDPPLSTPKFGETESELLSIKTDANSNWGKAKVTQFTARVSYKKEFLKYVGTSPADVKGSGLDNTWNIVSATTSIDNSTNEEVLTIVARGTTPLSANSQIAKFPLQFLAAIMQDPYNVKLEVISQDSSSGNDRICVIDSMSPGVIIPYGCFADGRKIEISGTLFGLMKVTPQPTTGNNANIQYTIGFDADTKVQIINMLGEIVATPVDKRHSTGAYSVSVPLDTLSAGKYIVRLATGPFIFVEDLVVTK